MDDAAPEFRTIHARYRALGWQAWAEALRALWGAREVLVRMTWREVASRYRQSVLGPGWALVTPLVTIGVFAFLHRARLLDVEGLAGDPGLFVCAALLPWQLLHACLTRSTQALVAQPGLVGRVRFPREVLVLSAVASALVDFLVSLVVLGGFFLALGRAPAATALLLPLPVLGLLVLGSALGLLLSVVNAVFRDVGRLVPLAATLWLFLSPVFYPPASQGPGLWLNWLNPAAPFLANCRSLLLEGRMVLPGELAVAALVSLLLLCGGWRVFQVMAPRAAELV